MNLNKIIKEEMLLLEGATSILYHYTSIPSFINITKENAFYGATNIGSPSDYKINKDRFFFFSTTRSKSTGYNSKGVRLVLDGRKLNQRYKIYPIDYWSWSQNPKDYGDVENNKADKNAYMNALQSKENEDRVALKSPKIDNALSYILEAHILLDRVFIEKESLDYIIKEYKEKNIPLFFYNNYDQFLLGNKNKTIDPASYKNPIEISYTSTEGPLLYGIENIAALLSYQDEGNYYDIINDLNLSDEEIKNLDEQIKHDTERYLEYPSGVYFDDYKRKIKSTIHNNRSDSNSTIRYIFKKLADDMKRYKVTNINDYIDRKAK